jgi:hypothetical protein
VTRPEPSVTRVGAAVVAIAVALGALVAACGGESSARRPSTAVVSDDTEPTHDFLVPRGTNELIEHGADIQIVPNPLVLRVGDVIRIRNQDTVGYTVGPFFVGAGQTMTQIATQPGTYKGMCLLHSGEELVVTIQER